MEVVFPAPFTPTTMITAGGSATCGSGRSVACRISSRCSRIRLLSSAMSPTWWRSTRWRMRSRISAVVLRADVGGDERVFQLFENLGVDFLAAADGVLELLHQPGAGLLDAGLQTIEKTRCRQETENLREECRKESG